MTHPTPKRYSLTVHELVTDSGYTKFPDVRQTADQDGEWMKAEQALAYAEAVKKQARLDAMDEVKKLVKSYPVGFNFPRDGAEAQKEAIAHIVKALDELKLKEVV